jgi:Domain of unknown function (DUF4048)
MRNTRHAKGLSLNFPILLPTQSPTRSDSPSPSSLGNVSPTSGSISGGATTAIPSRTTADFLTLVAAKERKVLELREELFKADAELAALKKQWASYEANKKQDEVRHSRKLRVSLNEIPSPTPSEHKDFEEERRRRRALMEMSHNAHHHTTGALGRRGSKRVFKGTHARTLSLLSPSLNKPAASNTIENLIAGEKIAETEKSASLAPGTPSITRKQTLETLVSPENLQAGLGKTYKHLAAHRRSLQPVAADMFMKQGKQVVDGVKEGLWTFFEDIRQATVGDEAVNGSSLNQRHPKHQPRPGKKHTSIHTPKDNSFWKEFGLEPPKKNDEMIQSGGTKQKSSIDSQKPPSLLTDTNSEAIEDDWDNWESSPSLAKKQPSVEHPPLDSEGLLWPELRSINENRSSREPRVLTDGTEKHSAELLI